MWVQYVRGHFPPAPTPWRAHCDTGLRAWPLAPSSLTSSHPAAGQGGPLHWACFWSDASTQEPIIDLLLANAGILDEVTSKGYTPFEIAVEQNPTWPPELLGRLFVERIGRQLEPTTSRRRLASPQRALSSTWRPPMSVANSPQPSSSLPSSQASARRAGRRRRPVRGLFGE